MRRRGFLLALAASVSGLALQASAAPAALRQVVLQRASGAAPVPGSQLVALPTIGGITYSRWHPAFSTVTKSGSRVTAATDLYGVADLAEVSASGPTEITDADGIKGWKFDGVDDYLRWADTLSLDSRAYAIFVVLRWARGSGQVVGVGATGTNNEGMGLSTSVPSPTNVPYYAGSASISNADTTNCKWTIAGTQRHLAAVVSRASNATVATPDKNQLIFVNQKRAQVAAAGNYTGQLGGEIGRRPQAGTLPAAMVVYDVIVAKGQLTDAQAQSIADALCPPSAWDLPELVNSVWTEGDSITAVVGGASGTAFDAPAWLLTNPGAAQQLAKTCRVVNVATFGNIIQPTGANSALPTKLANANSMAQTRQQLPGKNVQFWEIGANDFGTNGRSAAQVYADQVTYIQSLRALGVQPVLGMNIATANATNQAKIATLRGAGSGTGYRHAQFLTDCGITAADITFADQDLITVAGDTKFSTSADAGDTAYYLGDGLHLQPALGQQTRVSGGDVAANGIYAAIVARLAA